MPDYQDNDCSNCHEANTTVEQLREEIKLLNNENEESCNQLEEATTDVAKFREKYESVKEDLEMFKDSEKYTANQESIKDLLKENAAYKRKLGFKENE